MKMLKALAVVFAAAFPCLAQGQTPPNLTFGEVLTPAQWMSLFAGKQDFLGAAPLLITGGTLQGPLVLAPSTTTQSGLNCAPGAAPTTPNNGDIWCTPAGVFSRVNGVTVGPFSGLSSGTLSGTPPIALSFPGGVATYALNFNSSLALDVGSNLGVNLAKANTWTATQSFPNNSLTLAEFPTIGASTVLGSIAGGTPTALSTAQITTLINPFTSSLSGAVPAPGTSSGRILSDNGTWISPTSGGTVTSVAAGTGMAFTTITGSGSVAIDKATPSNYVGGAANKVLTADGVFTGEVGLTFSASLTLDFSQWFDAAITLTGSVTTLTCSNFKTNQSGVIRIAQDATGGRTMPTGWCSAFVWSGGTKGVLSTTPNTVDWIFYYCPNSTQCLINLVKAVS